MYVCVCESVGCMVYVHISVLFGSVLVCSIYMYVIVILISYEEGRRIRWEGEEGRRGGGRGGKEERGGGRGGKEERGGGGRCTGVVLPCVKLQPSTLNLIQLPSQKD